MNASLFPEYQPKVEFFRGTVDDLLDENVTAYCGPHSLPCDPSRPLILMRWPA